MALMLTAALDLDADNIVCISITSTSRLEALGFADCSGRGRIGDRNRAIERDDLVQRILAGIECLGVLLQGTARDIAVTEPLI